MLYRFRGRIIIISVSISPDTVASSSSASSFSSFSFYPLISSPLSPPSAPSPSSRLRYHYYGSYRFTPIFYPQSSLQMISNREPKNGGNRKVTVLLVLNLIIIHSDVWKFPMVICDSSRITTMTTAERLAQRLKIKARTAGTTTIRIIKKDQLTYSRNQGILWSSPWRKQSAFFSCKLYLVDGNIS